MNMVCGVICDSQLEEQYREKEYEIDGKYVSLRMIEIYAKSKDYEKMPELQTRAKEIYQKVAQEIKEFYTKGKADGTIKKHDTFLGYLDDLRAIFENACIRYEDLYTTIENERRLWKEKKNASGITELNMTRAKERYLTAEENFKTGMHELTENVKSQAQGVRDQFQLHLTAFYRVDANEIDNNSLKLLEADILTDAELEDMSNRNRGNITMLRLIGKYAGEKKSDISKTLSHKLLNLGNGNDELELFDQAVLVGNRCLNPQKNFAEVGRRFFNQSIDKIAAEMSGLYAQPMV